jgi:antitoxin (DNA-binding transcriptional repressor) of toxin-antitoxin stability system
MLNSSPGPTPEPSLRYHATQVIEGMIDVTASDMARAFHEFLNNAQHVETVLIRKHGRAAARLVPDADSMDGKRPASLFRSYKALDADKRAVDAIEAQIRKFDRKTQDALAHS